MKTGDQVRFAPEFISHHGFEDLPEAKWHGTIRSIEICNVFSEPNTQLAYVHFEGGNKRWVNVKNLTTDMEV